MTQSAVHNLKVTIGREFVQRIIEAMAERLPNFRMQHAQAVDVAAHCSFHDDLDETTQNARRQS